MRTLVLLHLLATMIPVPFGFDRSHALRTVSRADAANGCGSSASGSGASCRGSAVPGATMADSTSCSGDDSGDDDDSCDSDDDDDSSCDSDDAGDSCDSDDCNAAGVRGRHGHHALATGLVWVALPVPFAVVLRRRARKRAPR